jgi:hypothetical protein
VDLSTKLKLLSLRQQFWFVEAELLQAVFQQCGCNAGRTIRALTEIDPTMTWQSGKANDAQQSSAVDNNVNATAKQAGAQAAQKEPGRSAAQRQKRAEGRRERRKQEKFTLVTRKRRNTGNKAGSRASDGQDLRQQALDHASLRCCALFLLLLFHIPFILELRPGAKVAHASLFIRNTYYMEATRAYIRGDGQAAKNLSQYELRYL